MVMCAAIIPIISPILDPVNCIFMHNATTRPGEKKYPRPRGYHRDIIYLLFAREKTHTPILSNREGGPPFRSAPGQQPPGRPARPVSPAEPGTDQAPAARHAQSNQAGGGDGPTSGARCVSAADPRRGAAPDARRRKHQGTTGTKAKGPFHTLLSWISAKISIYNPFVIQDIKRSITAPVPIS